MKKFVINMFILLCFVAVCMGVSYMFPMWAVMGIVIALQIINLVASATVSERRDDDG